MTVWQRSYMNSVLHMKKKLKIIKRIKLEKISSFKKMLLITLVKNIDNPLVFRSFFMEELGNGDRMTILQIWCIAKNHQDGGVGEVLDWATSKCINQLSDQTFGLFSIPPAIGSSLPFCSIPPALVVLCHYCL